MKIISISEDGNLIFNWDLLPEKVSKNIELRDKIFEKIQKEFPVGKTIFNNKLLFDINKFVIEEIKNNLGGLK